LDVASDFDLSDIFGEGGGVLIDSRATFKPAEIHEAGYEVVLLPTIDEKGRDKKAIEFPVEWLTIGRSHKEGRHRVIRD
jgi:hypothetical protein